MEGTAGHIRGHRVTLGLDSASLATMDAVPAVRDGVCAAIAAAIAMHPGEAMADLHAFWAVDNRDHGAAYRGGVAHDAARDDPEASRAALENYLRVSGEGALADSMRAAQLEAKPTRDGHQVTVRLAAREHRTIAAIRHRIDVLHRAIRALMAGPGMSRRRSSCARAEIRDCAQA